MRVLLRAIRRETIQQLLLSLLLLVGGALVVYRYDSQQLFLTLLGMLGGALGLYFSVRLGVKLWRPAEHPLVRLLQQSSRQIVWIYALVTDRQPFGFRFSKMGTLYFKLADGDEFSVAVPSHQLKLVSKTLNRLLPHATFGYSDDKAQQYRIQPSRLLRRDDPSAERK